MKKIFISLLLICTLYAMEGCGQRNDKDTNDPMASTEEAVGKNTDVIEEEKEDINIITVGEEEIEETANDIEERESGDTIIEQDEENEVIENPYFPAKEHVSLEIHARYYYDGFVDEIATAEINRVKIYKEGSIYKLQIDIIPVTGSRYFQLDNIMNIYFYVTADKIYWILPYTQLEPDGETIYFYDDDEVLVKTLDTDEKLKNKGVLELVCQEEDMCGEYFSMTQEGNRITYYYSEIKVNGEPGGEHLFVWEKGKGLAEFGVGYGSGPMDVYIDDICEVSVKDRLQIEETANDIEERESGDTIIRQDEENEVIENPYFPAKEHVSLEVHAEYYYRGLVDEIATAEINRVKIYKEGSIYKLQINIIPVTSSWYFQPDNIMNIYFYVTADKIYWILPHIQLEPDGETIYFYDDDEVLVKTLDTDEKLKNKGVLELVCQEEDMCGEYFSMTQEGNRITYYYHYEIKVNGEPGGERLFVWEKGKGLVEFGIGYGTGPMDVHIDEICEVTEEAIRQQGTDKK